MLDFSFCVCLKFSCLLTFEYLASLNEEKVFIFKISLQCVLLTIEYNDNVYFFILNNFCL